MLHNVVNDYTQSTSTGNDNIKVFVRGRPTRDGSEPKKEMWPSCEHGKITIKDPESRKPGGEHAFLFDGTFWTQSTQEELFQQVAKPLVDHMLQGYNGCCFAYGQTGSGKTYTIFGERGAKRGLIPRCVDYAFEHAEQQKKFNRNCDVKVTVSMLEMYCDEMRDLGRAYVARSEKKHSNAKHLKTSDWYLERIKHKQSFAASAGNDANLTNTISQEQTLEIHEDLSGSVFVKNLSEIVVEKPSQVYDIVEAGFALRATHETRMNMQSSRSHTIFTLSVAKTDKTTGVFVKGTLNLVDLAGSERLNKSESEGQRLKETLFINTSLSALGKVAASLDPNTPAGFIPYRDSKLTRILQSSLGGNSHTSIIANLHPTKENYSECLGTLQFANRCRFVVNQPRINYTDEQGRNLLQETVRSLQAEVRRLRLTMAVVLARKNKQLQEILQTLGHKDVHVLDDGRVQTKSGQVIGSKVDMKAIERQVTITQQKAEARANSRNGIIGQGSFDHSQDDFGGSQSIESFPGAYSASPGWGDAAMPSRQSQQHAPFHFQNPHMQLTQHFGAPPGNFRAMAGVGGGAGSIAPLSGHHGQNHGAVIDSELMVMGQLNDVDLADLQISRSDLAHQLSSVQATLTSTNGGESGYVPQRAGVGVGAGGLMPMSTGLGNSDSTLAMMQSSVRSLRSENQRLREKLQKQKKEMKELEASHRKETIQNREEVKKLRETIQSLKRDIGESHVMAQSKLNVERKEYEGKIKQLLAQSQEIETRAQEQVARIPQALRVDSAKVNAAERQAERMKQILGKKHEEHVRELIRGHQDQLDNIKSQAEYWIKKKEDECRQLVKDFNQYHQLRAMEAREARKELKLLYSHCNNLSRVVNKVQLGEYRIRVSNSKNNLLSEVCIKPADLPDEKVLQDRKRLLSLKEQVQTLRVLEDFFEQGTAGEPVDGESSAELDRQDSWIRETNKVPQEASSLKTILDGVQYQGIRLDQDPDMLDKNHLCKLVQALRDFFTSQVSERILEEKLLKKISNNDTLTYIKTLEEGLETYKQSFKLEADRYRQLRVAFESLQRREERRNRKKKK